VVSEPPFIGGKALLSCKPAENLALERGSGPPNLVRHIIDLQMPERNGVETFVRELGVSEAAKTSIRGIVAQDHHSKFVCKDTKVSLSSLRKARPKRAAKVRCHSCVDINMGSGSVGEEVWEAFMEGSVPGPEVEPEGGGGPAADVDTRE
jgi:hypothetical protein